MFKIHLKRNPPSSYREAYDDKESARVAAGMMNHLYEKNIIVTNSFSCMFSTAITEKEVDVLEEAFRDTLEKFGSELKALRGA